MKTSDQALTKISKNKKACLFQTGLVVFIQLF